MGRAEIRSGAIELAVLVAVAPTPAAALGTLTRLPAAAPADGPAAATSAVVAAVGLLAWSLAGWLLLTAAATLLGRLPGGLGRVGRAVAGRVAPRAVRSAVAVALGLGLVAGTAGAAAASPGPAGPSWAASVADAAQVPPLDWPGAPAPTATAAPTPAPATTAPPTAAPPTTAPATTAPPPPATTGPTPADGADAEQAVVVRPGDTLWGLAAQRLGPAATDAQVAAAWPGWWSANRAVVGDDPDLLHPGQRLVPPTP